ncbi:MAG: FHA domain-containing protein, partial [Myxococcota bacterium]|nr:FHA domain-containing protein [Myxococcota bacterium]
MDTVQLKIEYADGRSEQRTLSPGVHRVGREAGEIVLGDPNVSGTHLELRVANGELFLTDVGSSNGTFDATGARVHGSLKMSPNQPYRLGGSSLTWLAATAGAGARGGTAAMPQYGAPPQYGA